MAEKTVARSMQLSRKIVSSIDPSATHLFALPERVLQFGTGVLLRGLPDYFIDKANRQGLFNGRVVVVKSTANGGTDAFAQQDGLYTQLERGIENGETVDRVMLNASISRVLSAAEQWDQVLECMDNPELQLIISNTTEIGIVLQESDAFTDKPTSFPGRLLALLQRRYEIFEGSAASGMVIVPTELIVDNGTRLRNIVLELARLKQAEPKFLNWLQSANEFCNSLVDRIVPGKLPEAEQAATEAKLGYSDELMIMSEPYRLWAIETGNERTKNILSFSKADSGVVIASGIDKFRELKLRLLNATHTFSCGLAHLAGFKTVKEAMKEPLFAGYLSKLMLDEIAPLITRNEISNEEARQFAASVIDRFCNPYIEHLWLSISMQYTSKMAMRTVPLISRHYANGKGVPERMAMGLAAYLLFSRAAEQRDGKWYGSYNGEAYLIQDDKAATLFDHWKTGGDKAIEKILADEFLFGQDLTRFNGLAESVRQYLAGLEQAGVLKTLASGITQKSAV